jgi:hypothetical protein
MPVAAARRGADGDEHRVGAGQRLGKVEGELEPACGDVLGDELVETRLEDRDAPFTQRRDFACVLVDAAHLMAEIGKARAGYQADVARADHHDSHGSPLLPAAGRLPTALALAAPAIGRNALLGQPQALGRGAALPEHVDRDAAARVPVAANAQPLRIHLGEQALANADGDSPRESRSDCGTRRGTA